MLVMFGVLTLVNLGPCHIVTTDTPMAWGGGGKNIFIVLKWFHGFDTVYVHFN